MHHANDFPLKPRPLKSGFQPFRLLLPKHVTELHTLENATQAMIDGLRAAYRPNVWNYYCRRFWFLFPQVAYFLSWLIDGPQEVSQRLRNDLLPVCVEHLRNDLLCIEWDVKPYTLTHSAEEDFYGLVSLAVTQLVYIWNTLYCLLDTRYVQASHDQSQELWCFVVIKFVALSVFMCVVMFRIINRLSILIYSTLDY